MWIFAGFLLGLVALSSIVGFHVGHIAHLVAVVAGIAAAGVLIGIAATGNPDPLVFVLLGADAVVTAGVGAMAWKGLTDSSLRAGHQVHSIVGREGLAVGDLNPSGMVRVHGENWSATSLNGRVEAGTRVQVIGVEGIRLTVWGEGANSTNELQLGEGSEQPPAIGASGQKEGTEHS